MGIQSTSLTPETAVLDFNNGSDLSLTFAIPFPPFSHKVAILKISVLVHSITSRKV